MLSDAFADEFLNADFEATDRYSSAVDQLSRLANGKSRTAFIARYKRVKALRSEVEAARFAMTKDREDLERSG